MNPLAIPLLAICAPHRTSPHALAGHPTWPFALEFTARRISAGDRAIRPGPHAASRDALAEVVAVGAAHCAAVGEVSALRPAILAAEGAAVVADIGAAVGAIIVTDRTAGVRHIAARQVATILRTAQEALASIAAVTTVVRVALDTLSGAAAKADQHGCRNDPHRPRPEARLHTNRVNRKRGSSPKATGTACEVRFSPDLLLRLCY